MPVDQDDQIKAVEAELEREKTRRNAKIMGLVWPIINIAIFPLTLFILAIVGVFDMKFLLIALIGPVFGLALYLPHRKLLKDLTSGQEGATRK